MSSYFKFSSVAGAWAFSLQFSNNSGACRIFFYRWRKAKLIETFKGIYPPPNHKKSFPKATELVICSVIWRNYDNLKRDFRFCLYSPFAKGVGGLGAFKFKRFWPPPSQFSEKLSTKFDSVFCCQILRSIEF